MQLRVPITLTPGRPRRAPPWALEAYSTPSPRPIPRAPPRAPSGPAALLAPPPLPATARSRALGPVTGRSSGPWSGIPLLIFLFPAPAGAGSPYSPYSGRKSRARVRKARPLGRRRSRAAWRHGGPTRSPSRCGAARQCSHGRRRLLAAGSARLLCMSLAPIIAAAPMTAAANPWRRDI